MSVKGFPRPALLLESLGLVLILSTSAWLRFHRLGDNPGWYSDEGTLVDIARHLEAGRSQYMALQGSTLLAARMPLAPWLLSALLPADGITIGALRSLSAASAVMAIALLYGTLRAGWGSGGARMALAAALAYAFLPQAVLNNRIGFSYNLLAPLTVAAFGGLWFYRERSRRAGLMVASLAIGLGVLVDIVMLSFLLPLALIALTVRRRDLAWAAPIALLPLGLYCGWMLARVPTEFRFDSAYFLGRIAGPAGWVQAGLITLNYGTLALQDPFWIPANLGLLWIRPKSLRGLALAMFHLPLLAMARNAGLAGLRSYLMIPILPFLALGLASALGTGLAWMIRWVESEMSPWVIRAGQAAVGPARQAWSLSVRAVGAALPFLLILSPLILTAYQVVGEVQRGFQLEFGWAFLAPSDARAAADYLGRVTSRTSLVVTSPALGWMLSSRSTDFQQAAAYERQGSVDYPTNVPRDRFAYPAAMEDASFVVIDPLWRSWGAVHLPHTAAALQTVEAWPQAFVSGEIAVYRNPHPPPP